MNDVSLRTAILEVGLSNSITRRIAGGLAALVLLVPACAAADRPDIDPDTVSEEMRYGGTAVVTLPTDPPTFNGLVAVDLESMWIHQSLLSMPLVRYDAETRPQPWLAASWDTVRVASDTLELTFHLRRDVRWHDGVPTTAEDVRFTYERMRDPAVGFPRMAYLQHWSPHVVVVDSFTIRFRLRAHAEFMEFWTWDVVKPAHVLRDVPPGELRNHPLGHEPMGNGPFRFVRRVPGSELVFEANLDFPDALGGRPYLDRIVFRVVPDATARVTELLTGGTDMVMLSAEQVRRVSDERRLRLIEYPHSAWTQIIWNTRRPPFDDVRVRRALSLAIDRTELIAGVLQQQGEPGRWTATPTHWQFDDGPSGEPRHDPSEARRLLAEAGWRDLNGEGILQDEHGRALRFTVISYRGSSIHAQTLPVLQAQLRRVGIDLQMRLLEQATAISLIEGRIDETGERVRNFDALLTNWETGLSSDDSWFLHSRNRNAPLAATGYADLRADSLMDLLAATLDRDAARPVWKEYQQYMVEESPVTVLYYPKHLVAVTDRLRNVEMVVAGPYASAPRWWLLPDRRRR
jgi:peptide/nickel transport system substrate-binding protein